VERIYSPTRAGDAMVYAGQPFGGEAQSGGWQPWITGPNAQVLGATKGQAPSLQWAFGTEMFKYFIFNDPAWDYRRYDLSTSERDTKLAATFLNADNPDLSGFTSRGGKLVLWHGWSDPALNAHSTIRYYEEVLAKDPKARDAVRLFMLPGVLHCFGGPGPDQVDWPGILVDWVERGKSPDRVVAAKLGPDRTPVRTRPLCVFPQRAVYTGSGSTDAESSFVCKAPE
jgi:feruloyl esterase